MEKEISIVSNIENISLVENFIDEISMDLSIVADVYGNILISVIEGVTNAIVHGNKNDTSKIVNILAIKDTKSLSIRIKDEGPGFDFENVPDPTKPDNVEKPDGRGVFLMSHLADDIVFDEGGSVVTLKFNI